MSKSRLLAYVVLSLFVSLINAYAVGADLQEHDAQNRASEKPKLKQRAPLCPGFDGNSDFYGLGIRLGVYLQWLASWLTNTLSPDEAGPSHDVNSIFVLAIVVAIITSIASDRIKPVEVYVMLLICLGYFFTVLSFLGIRLYFLRTASIAKAINDFKGWRVSWYASRKRRSKRVLDIAKANMADIAGMGVLGILKVTLGALRTTTLGMSFTSASSVKHRAVSWSGVVWRTTIASMVASINIYLWWSPWRSQRNVVDPSHCGALVFFFGRQDMSQAMITFFKVASIILAAPIFYLFLVLYQVLSAMLQLTNEVVLHHFFGSTLTDGRLFRSWDKLPEPMRKYIVSSAFRPISVNGLSPWLNILETYIESKGIQRSETPPNQDISVRAENPPSLDDLLKAYIGFLSRGSEETEGDASHDTGACLIPQCLLWGLCLVSHAVLLATMACFVVFVELTLTANNISGVYTLNSTGQLIPFIIGISSTVAAMREIALRYIRKVQPVVTLFSALDPLPQLLTYPQQHPDYTLVSLTVDLTAGTGRIEMRQKGSDGSAPEAVYGIQTANEEQISSRAHYTHSV